MSELHISLPRGDIRNVKFRVLSDGEAFSQLSEIFFTVKSNTTVQKVLFQKSLTKGDITLEEDGYYHFTIMDTDTDNLMYGSYKFDIEVLGDGIKQTKVGTLEITAEVTFASNEGE